MSDAVRHLNPLRLMDAGRFFSQVVIAPHGTTVYVAGQTGLRGVAVRDCRGASGRAGR